MTISNIYSILKSIEFASPNHSDDEQTVNNSPKKSLEMLLLEKNRALQSEQTQMKVTNIDLESKSINFNYEVNIMIQILFSSLSGKFYI